MCSLRNAALTEVATDDNARTLAGYRKTGDLITLPYDYTEQNFIEPTIRNQTRERTDISIDTMSGFGKITLQSHLEMNGLRLRKVPH